MKPDRSPLKRTVGLFGLTLLIAGCAAPRVELSEDERQIAWTERAVQLQSIDTWNLRARSVITVDTAVYSLGLGWKRQQDKFTMTLEAPFGQGVFRIQSDPAFRPRYSLLYPEGQILRNQNAEALLEQAVGWSLPVSGLRYWMVGLPDPASPYSNTLDRSGRLSRLEQDGWSIRYQDYFDDDPSLPRKLLLQREQLELRIVVDSWQPQLAGPDQGTVIFPQFD